MSNPCLNGGKCVDTDEEDILFTCNCASGYSGKTCAQIITSCSTTATTATMNCSNQNSYSCEKSNKCQNGGTCSTTTGQCICSFGYSGTYCEDCKH